MLNPLLEKVDMGRENTNSVDDSSTKLKTFVLWFRNNYILSLQFVLLLLFYSTNMCLNLKLCPFKMYDSKIDDYVLIVQFDVRPLPGKAKQFCNVLISSFVNKIVFPYLLSFWVYRLPDLFYVPSTRE